LLFDDESTHFTREVKYKIAAENWAEFPQAAPIRYAGSGKLVRTNTISNVSARAQPPRAWNQKR
jgi:hypothetical protein